MNKTQANKITAGLSRPSKMPCYSYNLPAIECITGSKLRDIPGSVCAGCYALKGRYIMYKKVLWPKMYRALDSLSNNQWIEAMAHLINNQVGRDPNYFRWHDSGDLQSIDHLKQIVEVCELTPTIKHWLPTREYKIVSDYRAKYGEFPVNLVVRLSAHMVTAKAPRTDLNTSTVGYNKDYQCPASKQDNKCIDCRACWNNKVKNVNYKLH